MVDGGNLVAYLGQLLDAPAWAGRRGRARQPAARGGDAGRRRGHRRAAAGAPRPGSRATPPRSGSRSCWRGFPERLAAHLHCAARASGSGGALRCPPRRLLRPERPLGRRRRTSDDPSLAGADLGLPRAGAVGSRRGRAAAARATPPRASRRSRRPRRTGSRGSRPRRSRELGSCLEPGTAEPVDGRGARGAGADAGAGAGAAHAPPRRGAASAAVRLAALRATARIAGSRAEVVLLRGAGRPPPADPGGGAGAAGAPGRRDRSVATLVALLGTADSLRFHVIRALGHCRAQSAATRLRDLYPAVRSPRAAPDRLVADPDRAVLALRLPPAASRRRPIWTCAAPRRRDSPRSPGSSTWACCVSDGRRRRLGHPQLGGARPRPAGHAGSARTRCSPSRATWSRWSPRRRGAALAHAARPRDRVPGRPISSSWAT